MRQADLAAGQFLQALLKHIFGVKLLYPELPLVSPYEDLAQKKFDYWSTNEGKNFEKIANPQAFTL
jgi:hypothetical protein